MSFYRRSNTPGGLYFFTVVSAGRRPILTQPDIRIALRQAIVAVRQNYPFTIHAWVLLPDHLHTIWQLPPHDADFSVRWNQIKRRVTSACEKNYHDPTLLTTRRRAKRHGTLWQHRFWEHEIRNERDCKHHMDYVHFNPVKHGLAARAVDWPWSSFHRLVKQGVYPEDWGNNVVAESR
ncbi:MAG TPA: transposase [Thiopseudomonas sp.]|nr:transposase [Thiopseudomonas sp.]